jgi:2,3-bisphosphoglycerate-independent phosphoglycerate mutase
MRSRTASDDKIWVLSHHGRYPFQTGMVTSSLLRRGLSMDDATNIARAVRNDLTKVQEISTADLRRRIEAKMIARLGADALTTNPDPSPDVVPMVRTSHGIFPFSKGVVLQQLDTAGLELETAMRLVAELERRVRASGQASLSEEQLYQEVARLLREKHGEEFTRRYQLTHWVQGSRTSVVILIGGATGTGKSTLAMELAYRLGVHWVTSTDMIRETMRSVVSPALVPGLHDHSFRGMVVGGQVLSNPRERVLAGFRQQAAQVMVGVRAVIQRALREHGHIIIEGTHIAPPFTQYVPEGSAHVAGFILAVPDEKVHRDRFPERSREQPERHATTYLDAFQSVRWIHDDLLRMAEEAEAVVLPNLARNQTLIAAVDILSRGLPVDHPDGAPSSARTTPPLRPSVPTLILIIDGLADEPNPALDDRTPLAAAETPTLRRLASSGGQGQVLSGGGDHIPGTDEGILALLGSVDQQAILSRGTFEALGLGIPLPPDAVLLRGNLATLDPDGRVVDRRAGRIRDGIQDLVAELKSVELSGGIVGRVLPTHEHRLSVMLVGPGLSPAISDTDPGESGQQQLLEPRPLNDSPEAARSAEALRELLTIAQTRLQDHPLNRARLARGLLPANAVITRGAAATPQRRKRPGGSGAMVARCNTAQGVARYLGMRAVATAAMTGSLDTNLDAKFDLAAKLLAEVDYVVVHVKGADIAAHDQRPLEKRDFIGDIDAALGRFLQKEQRLSGQLRVVVSADHGTSSLTGNHLGSPVPLLLATWNAETRDEADFTEESAARGALGVLRPGELRELLGLDGVARSIAPPA